MNRFFVPISIGNPKYTPINIERVLDFIAQNGGASCVVLCDSLRMISNRIKGADDLERAERNALQAVGDTARMVERIVKRRTNTKVLLMSQTELDLKSLAICGRILAILHRSHELYNFVDQLAIDALDRFDIPKSSQSKSYELYYLIAEAALSLYVTGILGYSTEIYIQGGSGLVDEILRKGDDGLIDLFGPRIFARKLVTWSEIGI